MNACSYCGTTLNLQRHHVYPVCHFTKKDNHFKIILCANHHLRIEGIILKTEAEAYRKPYGRRYKLEKPQYEAIVREFLATSEVPICVDAA